jgi:hypothetical protein
MAPLTSPENKPTQAPTSNPPVPQAAAPRRALDTRSRPDKGADPSVVVFMALSGVWGTEAARFSSVDLIPSAWRVK